MLPPFRVLSRFRIPGQRSFTRAAVLWISSVLIFSLIYWGLWYSRPDAFILNKEFNLTPIQHLQTKLWGEDRSANWSVTPLVRAPVAAELDSLVGAVAELDRTAVEVEKALPPLVGEQSALEADLKRSIEEHSSRMWSNVEKYKSQAWAAEKDEVKRQESLVASLEKHFGADPPPHQGIVVAQARVALAHARYREAVKMAEVGEYVLKNLGSFSDPEALSNMQRVEEKLQANALRQRELSGRLSEVRQRAQDSLEAWYTGRRDRLEWIDFLVLQRWRFYHGHFR